MLSIWLDYAMLLLQSCSVVITAAFVLFRIPALRHQLLHQTRFNKGQVIIVLLFSVLAIYGTHAGKVVSPQGELEPVTWSQELDTKEAVVNFRDMVVVAAGLAAGPWLGMSVGAIAGLERYILGGFTAVPCALASVLSGLLAGLFRWRAGTMVTPFQAAVIAAASVLLQMVLILWLATPREDALQLVHKIGVPMLLTATLGCIVFQQLLGKLDKVRLELIAQRAELRAQRAEIRALHAQIEPHFLMNTLNAIKALIRIDPEQARHYVTLLGEFLRDTRAFAILNTIKIEDELKHTKQFLDFQKLRFPEIVHYREHINEPAVLDYRIPPRTLLMLVENSLSHGHSEESKVCTITISARLHNHSLVLSVQDDGRGIDPQRLKRLGKEPVDSSHREGGQGLYHLHQTLKEIYGKMARLEIDSVPHQGTTVRLVLPLKETFEGHQDVTHANIDR